MSARLALERLRGKAARGMQGYPLATIAWYGPSASRATKVAVGIQRRARGQITAMEKWYGGETDVREDASIGAAILRFLQAQGVRSVVMSDGLLGCPHEEGIDYPLGASCPACPYWAGRLRPS